MDCSFNRKDNTENSLAKLGENSATLAVNKSNNKKKKYEKCKINVAGC